MPRDKLEPFYLHFHQIYKHHTWHSNDLNRRLSLIKLQIPLVVWSRDVM